MLLTVLVFLQLFVQATGISNDFTEVLKDITSSYPTKLSPESITYTDIEDAADKNNGTYSSIHEGMYSSKHTLFTTATPNADSKYSTLLQEIITTDEFSYMSDIDVANRDDASASKNPTLSQERTNGITLMQDTDVANSHGATPNVDSEYTTASQDTTTNGTNFRLDTYAANRDGATPNVHSEYTTVPQETTTNGTTFMLDTYVTNSDGATPNADSEYPMVPQETTNGIHLMSDTDTFNSDGASTLVVDTEYPIALQETTTNYVTFMQYSDVSNMDGASATTVQKITLIANFSQILSLISNLSEIFFDTPTYNLKLNTLREIVRSLQDNDEDAFIRDELASLEQKLFLWIIIRKYLDPVMFTLIILVGTVGNATLLIIFARHRKVRTAPNLIIFNIAISDMVSLIGIAPIFYVTEYLGADVFPGTRGCYVYVFVRVTIMGVTEFSIATQSMQRLLATKVFKKDGSFPLLLTTSSRTVRLVILNIWILSVLISIPIFFAFEFTDGTCFPHILTTTVYRLCLIFYILLFVTLPLPIVYLSIVTVQRLKGSAAIPARTSMIITILAIFYLLVYIPRTIWYGYVSWYRINRRDVLFIFIDEILSFLHFLDACLNPVALYWTSKTFRNLFAQYLFFWQKPKKAFTVPP